MSQFQPTSHEEDAALWQDYTAHPTPETRNRLVLQHMRLVCSIVARRFKPPLDVFDDYVQVGVIGLIQAIERFDPSRNLQFTSYATPTITGIISHYKRDQRPIKDRKGIDAIPAYFRAEHLFLAIHGVSPENSAELAAFLGCSDKAVDTVQQSISLLTPASLDAAIGDTDDEGSTLYAVVAVDTPDPYQEVDRLAIRQAVELMPNTQLQAVAWYRFYDGLSQAEVAKILGVCQMRVSRLEQKAIDWLRSYFGVVEPIVQATPKKKPLPAGPSRGQLIKEFIAALHHKEAELNLSPSSATVTLREIKGSRTMQPSKTTGTTSIAAPSSPPVRCDIGVFGTAILAFFATTQSNKLSIDSDPLMLRHRPKQRDRNEDITLLSNENMVVEVGVGVGSGLYKRGKQFTAVCVPPEDETPPAIEILPTIFPGLVIEFNRPYNLVTLIVSLKQEGPTVPRPVAGSSSGSTPTPPSPPAPPADPPSDGNQLLQIFDLPPSEITALLLLWPELPSAAEEPRQINVSEYCRQAGLNTTQVFGPLATLQDLGYFYRPRKGMYRQGTETQFRCTAGRTAAVEVNVLPKLYPDLRLTVGKVYDIGELTTQLTKQTAELSTPPTPTAPTAAPTAPLAGMELVAIPIPMLEMPAAPTNGSVTTIDGEIVLRQEHLKSLEAFKARLGAILLQVETCQQETTADITALEAARDVLIKPLPGLQAQS